jgi:hypothetical protein
LKHSQAELLRALLASEEETSPKQNVVGKLHKSDILLNLVAYGAPLGMTGKPGRELGVEATLVEGLRLSYQMSEIHFALPAEVWK